MIIIIILILIVCVICVIINDVMCSNDILMANV